MIGKRIFKLTIGSFAGPFVATFFVVLFSLLIQFLWKYIDDMVGKGLEWYIILELLFFASASFVPLALPLSILLSSIMAFGKLSETYELVALKSAGVSLLRILIPMTLLVIVLSIGAFFFTNNTIPVANLKFHALLYDIRQQRPAFDIREGVFYNGIENYSIRIDKKDKRTNLVYGIRIYDHTMNRGCEVVLLADSGIMQTSSDQRFLLVTLYNGARYEEMESKNLSKPTYPHNRQFFKQYELRFDLSGFKLSRTREELFKDHYEMLSITQLTEYKDSIMRVADTTRFYVANSIKPFIRYYQDSVWYSKQAPIKKPVLLASIDSIIPLAMRKNVYQMSAMNARTIKQILDEQTQSIDGTQKLAIRYEIEWHRKFALSFACLSLFFIGAPLGAIIRKGGLGLPTVVAIIMFLIFYVITIVGEKTAKQGAISTELGMWIPTMILLPIGLFLIYRANKDSISFNKEAFIRRLRELLIRLKLIKLEDTTPIQ